MSQQKVIKIFSMGNMAKNKRQIVVHKRNKQSLRENNLPSEKILKQSSIFALSQIGRANKNYHKLIWLLILLISLIGCIYKTQEYVSLFFTYPVVISLLELQQPMLNFPAVTVCNLNRMKLIFDDCDNTDILEKGCLPIVNPESLISTYSIRISERRSILSCSATVEKSYSLETSNKLDFLAKYMKIDSKNRQFVGHQAQDMIKYCSFEMQACFFEEFAHFQSLRYGNCYTFNKANSNGTNILKSTKTGYNTGLELLLALELEDYMNESPSVGMRISIHDASQIPNPEEYGVDISPGFETSIAIKQVIIHRLPAPYRDHCINYTTRNNQNNNEECMKLCLQEHSNKICKCIDPTLLSIPNVKHCNMKNETDVCCLDNVQDRISQNNLTCDCPLPCFSVSYEQEISTATLPYRQENSSHNQSIEHTKMNYVRLKIFYSSLVQSIYTQFPMFDKSEIFSNLGGELSLWLGLSLLALFEFIETIIHFVSFCGKVYIKG